MQTYVAKRLIDANSTAVDVSDTQLAINQSIEYWKFRRFSFNEVSDTATLTAQSQAFPYPSNFLVPATDDDGFYIQYGQIRYPLVKISQQLGDSLFVANGYGLPRWYYPNGDVGYQCYPIPDQAYTVGRHYLKDYPALVGSTDTNDFTNTAARLILLWTLGNMISELRQDIEMGSYYATMAQNEARNLRVLSDKKNGTGKLTIHSTLAGVW